MLFKTEEKRPENFKSQTQNKIQYVKVKKIYLFIFVLKIHKYSFETEL
jgi:hypothetical protein